MKIITCSGYYRTGSSAITDFLSEFSTCGSVGNYEFRFIHDPDGVRDLEYNIVENNNRLNTSNAIKRYMKRAKMLNGGSIRKGYKRYMGQSFELFTQEYINNLTELKAEAWWHFDEQSRGNIFNFIDLTIDKLYKKLFPRGRTSLLKLTHEQSYFSAISKEKFYQCTKEYIYKVINSMDKNHPDFLMIDQLLPASNVNQYLNYFDEIKVIVVDRDPRDIFVLENEIYKWGNIPYKNVKEYCKWFEIIRRHRKSEQYDSEKVLFVQFEDLIYKYEDTTDTIINFIGLNKEDHIHPRKYFDPDVSVNGTRVFERYPKYIIDISYIESNLTDYLYDFPSSYHGSVKDPNWCL